MVQVSPEVIAVWKQTRSPGQVPSLFIEGYWVNRPEQCFEVWLYRKGFRPASDNFLGKTETMEGLDADTLNEYYHDREKGFMHDRDNSCHGWTWGNVAAFASAIKSIKRFVVLKE